MSKNETNHQTYRHYMQGILRVALAVSMLMMKAGIPIDIITGTSMGSIVGGLYAIGYDAQSLDSVARAQD